MWMPTQTRYRTNLIMLYSCASLCKLPKLVSCLQVNTLQLMKLLEALNKISKKTGKYLFSTLTLRVVCASETPSTTSSQPMLRYRCADLVAKLVPFLRHLLSTVAATQLGSALEIKCAWTPLSETSYSLMSAIKRRTSFTTLAQPLLTSLTWWPTVRIKYPASTCSLISDHLPAMPSKQRAPLANSRLSSAAKVVKSNLRLKL